MTPPQLRRLRASPFVLVLATLPVGCARHATATECSALLDRYVELLVREQDPKASDAEIAKQKGLTREKASHDASFASCPKEVSSRELGCAMGAPNVDEFEKCLE
jgi:hypothetical protein